METMRVKVWLALIFLLGLFWWVPGQHSPSRAEPPSAHPDALVMTGQIIPAFIGGAYDPTEGFQQLAGLPIYVYTIDNFGTAANFVTHSIAIRTQIRADGTFQAQGVTSSDPKAIYFPFTKDGDHIIRTDCHQNVNAGTSDWCPTNGPWGPSGYLLADYVAFRWPEPSDRIQDVFSYAYIDPGSLDPGNPGTVVVNSQICKSPPTCAVADDFEKVIIRQSFITTTTRLDKENSINVFPVVPHRAIRVDITSLGPREEGATYEVAAIRVSGRYEQATLSAGDITLEQQLGYPLILGRSTPLADTGGARRTGVFMAYAPEGYYAVTVWRSQPGALSYLDYNGTTPLNSEASGFGVIHVHHDWNDWLNAPNPDDRVAEVYVFGNRIVTWGTVVNSYGDILSEENRDFGKICDPAMGTPEDYAACLERAKHQGDLKIRILSDSNQSYYGKLHRGAINIQCQGVPPNDDHDVCGSNQTIGAGWFPFDRSWHGVYALFQTKYEEFTGPLNEHNWVYIDGYCKWKDECKETAPDATDFTKGIYQSSPTPPPRVISSKDGPVRVDLVVTKSAKDHAVGFDTGIHLLIKTDTGTEEVAVPTAEATLSLTNPLKSLEGQIPALHKVYTADRLGWIHIPDGDLLAFPKNPITAANSYLAMVTSGGKVYATPAGNKAIFYSNDSTDSDPTDNGSYRFYDNTLITGTNYLLAQATTPQPYYMFLGKIPLPFVPTAYAASEMLEIPVTIHYPAGQRPQGPVLVYANLVLDAAGSIREGKAPCNGAGLPCEIGYYDNTGTWISTMNVADAPDGRFAVRIFRTLSEEEYRRACTRAGHAVETCNISGDQPIRAYSIEAWGTLENSASEKMDFVASQKLSVDAAGIVTPGIVDLYPGIDCRKMADEAYPWILDPRELGKNFQHAVLRTTTNFACEAAKQFIERAPQVFGTIQRTILQTRPVSEMSGIVQLWNVMRALTNVFFIVILILIAFATILGWNPKEWSLGVVLPSLIINMLLANFSLLLIQATIDGSNILTQSFFNLTAQVMQGMRTDVGTAILPTTGGVVASGALVASALGSWISTAVISGLSMVSVTGGFAVIPVLLFALLGVILFILTPLLGLVIILLARYALIWIATILAPLVFALSTLPGKSTQGLRGVWASTLMPFIFMTPIIALVMSIGLMLLSYSASENSFVPGLGIALTAIFTLKLTTQVPGIASSIFGKGFIDTRTLPGQDTDWTKKQREILKTADERDEKGGRRAGYAQALEQETGRKPLYATRFGRFIPGLAAVSDIGVRRETGRQKAIDTAEKSREYLTRTKLGMGPAGWKQMANAFFHQDLGNAGYSFRVNRGQGTPGTLGYVAPTQVGMADLKSRAAAWKRGKQSGVNAFRDLYGWAPKDWDNMTRGERKELQGRLRHIGHGMTQQDYQDLQGDLITRGGARVPRTSTPW